MPDTETREIFAYGSLLWNPGFDYEQKTPARLSGYHRAFCRLSVRHRGTPERPGMVVGLEPGGSCQGLVYRVAPDRLADVLVYLDEREGAGYRRRLVEVELEQGGHRQVLTYLPETDHPTYAPALAEDRIVELLRDGVGKSGRARDYLKELVEQLRRLQIDEPAFERLWERVAGS